MEKGGASNSEPATRYNSDHQTLKIFFAMNAKPRSCVQYALPGQPKLFGKISTGSPLLTRFSNNMVFSTTLFTSVLSFVHFLPNHSSAYTVFCLHGCFSKVSKHRVSRGPSVLCHLSQQHLITFCDNFSSL